MKKVFVFLCVASIVISICSYFVDRNRGIVINLESICGIKLSDADIKDLQIFNNGEEEVILSDIAILSVKEVLTIHSMKKIKSNSFLGPYYLVKFKCNGKNYVMKIGKDVIEYEGNKYQYRSRLFNFIANEI